MSEVPKFKTFADLKTIALKKQEIPKLELVEPSAEQARTAPAVNPKLRSFKADNKISKAPEKDFNKRANILEREALPQGLFPGASKKIYDAFYLRTLGSISGVRTIQATRGEIMQWSGIKNIKTVNAHLKKLRDSKLLDWTIIPGEHEGSLYEVSLPSESLLQLKLNPDQTQTRPRPDPDQKMVYHVDQKMVWVGLGNPIENKGTYEIPKTSFKTSTDDDDKESAFSGFVERFKSASKKLTGRSVTKRETEKWTALADLLILELEVAASQTDGVSSVPAFLTGHLRRKLLNQPIFKTAKATSKTGSKLKTDTVGKSDMNQSYEIKPLAAPDKRLALEQLREFKNEDFLPDFKKWYTAEDWLWLMNELEKE